MVMLWVDGAEMWGDATYLSRAYAAASGLTISTPGRVTPGARYFAANTAVLKTPSLAASTQMTIGFGFYATTAGAAKVRVFSGASEQCRLELESDGAGGARWKLIRGSTTIGTSSSFSLGQWLYFELQVDIATSGAAYELRQNEQNVLSGTGANLANTGSAGADAVGWETPASGYRLDDLYVLNSDNSDGANNNDFLGDSVEYEVTPNANGHQQDFTRSTGSSNVANVDEASTASSSADYNHSDTTNQEDYYGFSDLPGTGLGNIHAIKISGSMAMQGVGSRTAQYRYYNGATEFDLGSAVAVSGTSIVELPQVVGMNPDTAAKWQASEVNAGEFGVEVAS